MKKTYIAPSIEIENTLVQSLMAVSLPVTKGNDGDVADSRTELDFWNDESEE